MRPSDTGFVIHRGVIARSMVWVRLIQLVNFVFGTAYALFALRFILAFARARESTAVVTYLNKITDPIYRPFRNVLQTTTDRVGHPFVWSLALTVVVLVIAHVLIRKLIKMSSRPAVEVEL
jgi:uncharacterized protein YggT (Ycf19 family)